MGKEPTTRFQWSAWVIRYWHFAFVIALSVVLWAPRWKGPIDLRWDAGVYYVLGTSLATGHGYRIISEPGAPEAVQYPPLLPGIVALYERLLESVDPAVVGPWLRLSYAVLFLLYGVAALILARQYLPPLFALGATVLCLLHHSAIFLSDALFTELPFAVVGICFVLWGDWQNEARRTWTLEVPAFLLGTIAFLMRTAGVVLFIAWIIEALMRRRWRLGIVRLLLALIPILLWQAHVARVHRSDGYRRPAYEYQRAPYQFYNVTYAENMLLLDPSRPELGRASPFAMVRRFAGNVRYVIKAAGESMSAGDFYWRQSMVQLQDRLLRIRLIPTGVVLIPVVGLTILAVVGLLLLAHARHWLFVLYVIGSIALVCIAPWRSQFERYLAPIAPLLAIAAAFALVRFLDLLQSRLKTPRSLAITNLLPAGTLALVLGVQVCAVSSLFYDRAHDEASYDPDAGYGPHLFYHNQLWAGWEQAMGWIKNNALPDAIIATRRSPHLCYLKTGRRAVSPPLESDLRRARHLLVSVPISYVVVDSEYTLPAIQSDPDNWHLIETFGGTKLYAQTQKASE